MSQDIEQLVIATGMLVRETKQQLRGESEALLQAVGALAREERKRVDRAISGVAAVVAAGTANAAALVAPAATAAEARRDVLLRRRTDTMATLLHWLERCVDDDG
ncbi:hypothetical protein [Neoroseomonas soli]|uniref:Uncharacterized protein n=1 Tax=Neoroseomonas soli TaxID=1081025 RepID=A0A9X9WVI9_9PROT|nr:hypothetical protein [Neoroseomonas soli]MBR0671168.1 hypothetical protein [Neoroseomonas soli]